MSNNQGPGVRRFWELRARGAEVDVTAIVQEHPNEALALADAIHEATIQEDSAARERMWLARSQVLKASGEEVTLGSLLRTAREKVGLSASDLSRIAQGRGVKLLAASVRQLEADRAKITNVTTTGLWSTLADVLMIDRHRLVAAIQAALSGPEPAQRFTRMNRGTTGADRVRFLTMESSKGSEENVAGYLDWVRAELGLPPTPTNTVQ